MSHKIFMSPVEAGLIEQTDKFFELPFLKNGGFFSMQEKREALGVLSPFTDAERGARHRLVEASKSPTHENDALELAISRQKFLKKINAPELVPFNIDFTTGEKIAINPAQEFEPQKTKTPHGQVGCSTIVQFREWSDEWRIRTEAMGTVGSAPPSQSGERISELLSQRGAKKIAESCEYMSLKKGGFKTFVTGTFKPEAREKIASGETTIQKEVSRCMDALQKMYQRGWVTLEGEKIAGHSEGLSYCWVVEIPKNEQGENNPHIHLLMGWSVPFRLFKSWSERIESIWGNGTFHLEKIKDCACAGAYMAKAAGYLTKAQGDETQGRVRGNRYGISEPARAPEWVTYGKSQLHTMGQIIADVYDHLTIKYGADYRERKTLKNKLDATPKDNKALRQKIGEKLQAVREKLKALPIRCNKYQVILKGQTVAGTFISWAKGEPLKRPDWLPELPADLAWDEGGAVTAADSHGARLMRKKIELRSWRLIKERFTDLKIMRRAALNTDEYLSDLVARWDDLKNSAFSGWNEYENFTGGKYA